MLKEKILEVLKNKKTTFNKLVDILEISPDIVSSNLQELEKNGIIKKKTKDNITFFKIIKTNKLVREAIATQLEIMSEKIKKMQSKIEELKKAL